MEKSNGKCEIVTAESPFAPFRNAIIALGAAQRPREKQQRVKALFGMLGAFEASFFATARELGAAHRLLLEVTGGEFMALRFTGRFPEGTSIRVLDANDVAVPILDLVSGKILKLPVHVEPLSIEAKLPDGTLRRIMPGQPADVAPKPTD